MTASSYRHYPRIKYSCQCSPVPVSACRYPLKLHLTRAPGPPILSASCTQYRNQFYHTLEFCGASKNVDVPHRTDLRRSSHFCLRELYRTRFLLQAIILGALTEDNRELVPNLHEVEITYLTYQVRAELKAVSSSRLHSTRSSWLMRRQKPRCLITRKSF